MAGCAADRKPCAAGLRVRRPEAASFDGVVTFGAGHFYISQSDKGGLVFGGDIDGYNSYAQRGNLPSVEHVMRRRRGDDPDARPRRVLRSWGGIMDMSMDGSPIIDQDLHRRPLSSMPAGAMAASRRRPPRASAFAHLLAKDAPHPAAAAYRLDRFAEGRVIDEKGQGAQPNLH
jgi:glycine/D-amino acid oxidase-like deaminating enzyme